MSTEKSKIPASSMGNSHGPPGQWSTGLCGCFSDVESCCMTFWCPCITFGRVAEIVNKGSTSCGAGCVFYVLLGMVGCSWIYSCCNRTKLRQEYALEKSPCGDCLVHCFCEKYALCQEYRELSNRGYNMSLGWDGNMEARNRGVAMAPTVQGGMSRN